MGPRPLRVRRRPCRGLPVCMWWCSLLQCVVTNARSDMFAESYVIDRGDGGVRLDVVLADFDRDGDEDVFSRTTLGAYVYESRGSGTFITNVLDTSAWPDDLRPGNPSQASQARARSSRAVDYNRDGYMDVLYCGPTGIGVFQNCGEACPRANEYYFEHVAIADAVAGVDDEWRECYGERLRDDSPYLTIVGLRNDAIVTFDRDTPPEVVSPLTPNAVWSTFGDLTRSGTADIVYVNDSAGSEIVVTSLGGDSTFELQLRTDVPDLRQLRIADVNSDSLLDIVASHGTSSVSWFENLGTADSDSNGFSTEAQPVSDGASPNVVSGNFVMAHLNADDAADFVAFGINDDAASYIQWCLNGGDGSFVAAGGGECGIIVPTEGEIDAATACDDSDGSGSSDGSSPVLTRVSVGDVDGDDDVDIFAIVNDVEIVWWENSALRPPGGISPPTCAPLVPATGTGSPTSDAGADDDSPAALTRGGIIAIIAAIVGCATCAGCAGLLMLQVRRRSPDGSFRGFVESFKSRGEGDAQGRGKDLERGKQHRPPVKSNSNAPSRSNAPSLSIPEPNAPPLDLEEQSTSEPRHSESNSKCKEISVSSVAARNSSDVGDLHFPPPYSDDGHGGRDNAEEQPSVEKRPSAFDKPDEHEGISPPIEHRVVVDDSMPYSSSSQLNEGENEFTMEIELGTLEKVRPPRDSDNNDSDKNGGVDAEADRMLVEGDGEDVSDEYLSDSSSASLMQSIWEEASSVTNPDDFLDTESDSDRRSHSASLRRPSLSSRSGGSGTASGSARGGSGTAAGYAPEPALVDIVSARAGQRTDADMEDGTADADDPVAKLIDSIDRMSDADRRRLRAKKEHACPVCGKVLRSGLSGLKKHMKQQHGKVKGFACPTCGKLFPRKYNMEVHIKTHESTRPFKCPHCADAFSQKSNLKRHMLTKHLKPVKCPTCKSRFASPKEVETHFAAAHPGEKMPKIRNKRKPSQPAFRCACDLRYAEFASLLAHQAECRAVQTNPELVARHHILKQQHAAGGGGKDTDVGVFNEDTDGGGSRSPIGAKAVAAAPTLSSSRSSERELSASPRVLGVVQRSALSSPHSLHALAPPPTDATGGLLPHPQQQQQQQQQLPPELHTLFAALSASAAVSPVADATAPLSHENTAALAHVRRAREKLLARHHGAAPNSMSSAAGGELGVDAAFLSDEGMPPASVAPSSFGVLPVSMVDGQGQVDQADRDALNFMKLFQTMYGSDAAKSIQLSSVGAVAAGDVPSAPTGGNGVSSHAGSGTSGHLSLQEQQRQLDLERQRLHLQEKRLLLQQIQLEQLAAARLVPHGTSNVAYMDTTRASDPFTSDAPSSAQISSLSSAAFSHVPQTSASPILHDTSLAFSAPSQMPQPPNPSAGQAQPPHATFISDFSSSSSFQGASLEHPPLHSSNSLSEVPHPATTSSHSSSHSSGAPPADSHTAMPPPHLRTMSSSSSMGAAFPLALAPSTVGGDGDGDASSASSSSRIGALPPGYNNNRTSDFVSSSDPLLVNGATSFSITPKHGAQSTTSGGSFMFGPVGDFQNLHSTSFSLSRRSIQSQHSTDSLLDLPPLSSAGDEAPSSSPLLQTASSPLVDLTVGGDGDAGGGSSTSTS